MAETQTPSHSQQVMITGLSEDLSRVAWWECRKPREGNPACCASNDKIEMVCKNPACKKKRSRGDFAYDKDDRKIGIFFEKDMVNYF